MLLTAGHFNSSILIVAIVVILAYGAERHVVKRQAFGDIQRQSSPQQDYQSSDYDDTEETIPQQKPAPQVRAGPTNSRGRQRVGVRPQAQFESEEVDQVYSDNERTSDGSPAVTVPRNTNSRPPFNAAEPSKTPQRVSQPQQVVRQRNTQSRSKPIQVANIPKPSAGRPRSQNSGTRTNSAPDPKPVVSNATPQRFVPNLSAPASRSANSKPATAARAQVRPPARAAVSIDDLQHSPPENDVPPAKPVQSSATPPRLVPSLSPPGSRPAAASRARNQVRSPASSTDDVQLSPPPEDDDGPKPVFSSAGPKRLLTPPSSRTDIRNPVGAKPQVRPQGKPAISIDDLQHAPPPEDDLPLSNAAGSRSLTPPPALEAPEPQRISRPGSRNPSRTQTTTQATFSKAGRNFRDRLRPPVDDDDEEPSVPTTRGPQRNRPRARFQQRPRTTTSRPTTTTTTTTTTQAPQPAEDYYDYEEEEEVTTTTTTARPRKRQRNQRNRGRRPGGQGPGFKEAKSTTPKPTTTRNPNFKPRSDGRYVDYLSDPNFPRELTGVDLTDYPFYVSLPDDIDFDCEKRHDGYYASVPHRCQVWHYCFGGIRYDFLCPNYTMYDQTTFTCRFINTVNCKRSETFYNRNNKLFEDDSDGDVIREKGASTEPPPAKKKPRVVRVEDDDDEEEVVVIRTKSKKKPPS